MAQYKVMFVCLGNICRSPLAHAVFEEMVRREGADIFVESSGTGAWHVGEPADSRMRATAARHGVKIDHLARRFQPADLEEYDLIVPMDRSNRQEILRYAQGDRQEKVVLLREWDPQGPGDVPDPWYGGPEGFETVYEIVERSCRALLDDLRQRRG